MPIKSEKPTSIKLKKNVWPFKKYMLRTKWHGPHYTRHQDAHGVPFGPPYKDFHKMRLGTVFCPYLKKSLSWYTLKKKNGSLNSWASPAENNSDASAKTHQTNSDPSSNSRYYQPLLATFIYHPLHYLVSFRISTFQKRIEKFEYCFGPMYMILKRNQLKKSDFHILSVLCEKNQRNCEWLTNQKTVFWNLSWFLCNDTMRKADF